MKIQKSKFSYEAQLRREKCKFLVSVGMTGRRGSIRKAKQQNQNR